MYQDLSMKLVEQMCCPRCGSDEYRKNGRRKIQQSYQCKKCGRGFSRFYAVSEIDQDYLSKRFWEKAPLTRNNDECWEWQGSFNSTGYGQIGIKGKKFSSHRLSWLVNRGAIPSGLCVCHHCDNRRCVNPNHLFLGTKKDNLDDMDQKGRRITPPRPSGEANPAARLSDRQVEEIRELGRQGLGSRKIAKQVGCSSSQAFRIVRGESRVNVYTPSDAVILDEAIQTVMREAN